MLALIVIVPLPFTNGPPSLACAIMAIGLMEEDSITIVIGMIVGIFGAVIGISIIGTVWWLMVQAVQWVFGF